MMPREPEETNRDTPETCKEPIGQAADLAEALAAEKEKSAEYLASWQRSQADFLNYKRRTEQDRQEFCSFANADHLAK